MTGPGALLALPRANPAFARLWAAQCVSLAGDWFTLIALAVIVARDSGGSGLAVSGLLLARLLPAALVGPWSGVLVDRLDRRRLLIGTDVARAAIVLMLVPAAAAPGLGPVYALAALHFAVATVFEPARQALVPRLVRREDLVPAATLSSITWSAMASLGGLAGGSILAATGPRAAFAIDAATFLVSAALLAGIRPAAAAAAAAPAEAGDDGGAAGSESPSGPGTGGLRAGLAFARGHPATGAVLLVKTINGLTGLETFLPIYATVLFATGADGSGSMGVFYASLGLGALAGPLALNRVNDGSVRRMRRLIAAASAISAASLFLFAGAGSLAVAAAAVFLRGVGGSCNWTYSTVILQRRVPDRLRGRLFALDFASAQLAFATLAVVWGAWIDRVGLRSAALAAALLGVAPAAAWTALLGWMDRRDRDDAGPGPR